MSRKKPDKDPLSSLIPTVKDPFKSKPYVDPLKREPGEYKDPLSVPDHEYKDPLKSGGEPTLPKWFKCMDICYFKPRFRTIVNIPEYKPYETYHEYQLPDIDPVTGNPRRNRSPRQRKEEDKPKKTKQALGKSVFPPQVGSSVGSMKRMLRIQENLNF